MSQDDVKKALDRHIEELEAEVQQLLEEEIEMLVHKVGSGYVPSLLHDYLREHPEVVAEYARTRRITKEEALLALEADKDMVNLVSNFVSCARLSLSAELWTKMMRRRSNEERQFISQCQN